MEWVSPSCQTQSQHEVVKLTKSKNTQIAFKTVSLSSSQRVFISGSKLYKRVVWIFWANNLNSFVCVLYLKDANKYRIPQAMSLHTSLRYRLVMDAFACDTWKYSTSQRLKIFRTFFALVLEKQYKWSAFKQCLSLVILRDFLPFPSDREIREQWQLKFYSQQAKAPKRLFLVSLSLALLAFILCSLSNRANKFQERTDIILKTFYCF